jgi:hypothetical protein
METVQESSKILTSETLFSQIHRLIWGLRLKLDSYLAFLITSKVLDVRRQGATTEAYGVIRRKEERSKATQQMMP